MSWRIFGLAMALLTLSRQSLADQCEKVIEDALAGCDAAAADKAALQKLAPEDQDKAPALRTELAKLTGSPLFPYCDALRLNTKNCDTLASALSINLTVEPRKEPLANAALKEAAYKKIQSDRQTANNKSGSSAQTDPVESIQPITLAGGAVTLAGTRAGTKAIGTITVNPLALASPDRLAVGRIFDLSVSAPIDLSSGVNQDPQYFSARLRLNATSPFSAERLQKTFDRLMHAEGDFADALQHVLASAPDPRSCAESVATTHRVAREACGQDQGDESLQRAREEALSELQEASRAADRYYLGVDARVDVGDPTGTLMIGDKGTHVLGGLAAGIRIPHGARWDWELRGRAAGDYFKSRDGAAGPNPTAIYSLDWGAALIFAGHLQEDAKQRLAFGVGVEGRRAVDNSEATTQRAPTNYAHLNLMAIVPATAGGDLGLAVSFPLDESYVPRGTIVSLSTDLGLLDNTTAN
jgi:hypothetical protein